MRNIDIAMAQALDKGCKNTEADYVKYCTLAESYHIQPISRKMYNILVKERDENAKTKEE